MPWNELIEFRFKTIGRWVGGRVVVLGDYSFSDNLHYLDHTDEYQLLEECAGFYDYLDKFRDITELLLPAFKEAYEQKTA